MLFCCGTSKVLTQIAHYCTPCGLEHNAQGVITNHTFIKILIHIASHLVDDYIVDGMIYILKK